MKISRCLKILSCRIYAKKAGDIVVKRKILRVSGIGESAVDEAIAPIYKSYENVETSILFNRSEIEVHLTAKNRFRNESRRNSRKIVGGNRREIGNRGFLR